MGSRKVRQVLAHDYTYYSPVFSAYSLNSALKGTTRASYARYTSLPPLRKPGPPASYHQETVSGQPPLVSGWKRQRSFTGISNAGSWLPGSTGLVCPPYATALLLLWNSYTTGIPIQWWGTSLQPVPYQFPVDGIRPEQECQASRIGKEGGMDAGSRESVPAEHAECTWTIPT